MRLSDPRSVVAAKRDAHPLDAADIEAFIEGYTRGDVSDALASAFLMACVIRGMDSGETEAMTRALIISGVTLEFDPIGAPLIDKHSTGGVADGVTLIFAPLAAALGLAVVKLAGRGLGHTGGTLDKLESIPGLRTDLTLDDLRDQVAGVGCVVAAASAQLVPADAALYALRDATATVPSVPLIAASVMAKKLAVRTDLIILDIKSGSGAFMKTTPDAEALARACLELAHRWGRSAHAAVTDMSQPLGDAVGNALEVAEAVEVLRGGGPGRLRDLAVAFAGRALAASTGCPPDEGVQRAGAALKDGSALDRFRRMVQAQGGDPRVADEPESVLPRAPVILPLVADRSGFLDSLRAEEIGLASGALGASRVRKGDPIDPAVGIVVRPKVGDRLSDGDRIGEVHAREKGEAMQAAARTLAAMVVGDERVEAPPLIHGWFET